MGTIFRLVLRMQVTRGRLLALGGLGALLVLLAIAVRAESGDNDPTRAMFDVLDGLGLGVLAPVTALVLASAALGDLAEDRTLVYVWMRPVDRWRMALGALGAALCTALPFVLIPLVIATLIAGAGGDVLVAGVVSASVAVVGYSALFLGIGLRVRRALVWGLAYVVIWEGAVARAARGAARLSIQVYARSILAELADQSAPAQAASIGAAVIALLLVVAGGYAITVRWLQTADVA